MLVDEQKELMRKLLLRVHNRVLRSRLRAHFSLLIQPSRPSFCRNPDPAVIFNKVILIKIKIYLYTMGSKYGTITIRKHALMIFLNIISFCLRFSCFPSLRNFDSTFPIGTFQNCVCPCCVLLSQYFVKNISL